MLPLKWPAASCVSDIVTVRATPAGTPPTTVVTQLPATDTAGGGCGMNVAVPEPPPPPPPPPELPPDPLPPLPPPGPCESAGEPMVGRGEIGESEHAARNTAPPSKRESRRANMGSTSSH